MLKQLINPDDLLKKLLPQPKISIYKYALFKLPSITVNFLVVNPVQFFCSREASPPDYDTQKKLTIPPLWFIEELYKHVDDLVEVDRKSLKYAHLNGDHVVPLWVLTYWSAIHQHIDHIQHWNRGFTWLKKHLSSPNADIKQLAQQILDNITLIAWDTNVYCLLALTSIHKLTHFLSYEWLGTSHEDTLLTVL